MSPMHSVSRTRSTTVHRQGGHATLVFRRYLHHTPKEVWEALTNPAMVQQWFLTSLKAQRRVGGKITLVTGPERVQSTGRILAWEPPRLFEYEWNTLTDPLFPGEQSVIRWELTPREGGTLIVLTHSDLTKRTARVFGHGLPVFLNRLEALLDGKPLPDWQTHVEPLRASLLGTR